MKNTVSILFITLFIGCSSGSNDFTFQKISYGIYTAYDFVPFDSEDSPSGNYRYGHSKSTQIKRKTDTIPAKQNISFGVSFRLNSETDKEIILEKLWTPPTTIIDDQGKKFNHIKRNLTVQTNENLHTFYILEKEYEIIKGEWSVELFYKGKKIHEKKFLVQ